MDFDDIAPYLEDLGIDPSQIPKKKLQQIMSCIQKFADSPQMNSQIVEEMSKIMGVSLHGKIPGEKTDVVLIFVCLGIFFSHLTTSLSREFF